MRGITPIIATIVLLFIAIALAGTAWTYMSGIMMGFTGKSFTVPTGGAYCSNGRISVIISNVGSQDLGPGDFIVKQITGPNDYSGTLNITGAVRAGTSATLVNNFDCGNATSGCTSGNYVIRLGTAAGIQTQPAYC